MIAMMATAAANEWEDTERRSRRKHDWQDGMKRRKRRGRMFGSVAGVDDTKDSSHLQFA